MIRFFLGAVVLAAALAVGGVSAAERIGDFVIYPDTPDMIALNGQIDSSTVRDFHMALSVSPGAKIIILESPGGDVDQALRLAAEIRQRGLGTAIPAGYACYSACTYLYFAGRDHFTRGKLGVHRVSSEGYSDAAAAGVYDGDVRAAMRRYGASVEVIRAMVSTPPSRLHIFSGREIAAYSINHGAGGCLAAKYAGL